MKKASTKAGIDAVVRYAESRNSSALLIVQDGNVLTESCWTISDAGEFGLFLHGHTPDGQPLEDVASIQKSIVGLLISMAASRGKFDPTLPVSTYLGPGWSRAAAKVEETITIHHLTAMAGGLDRELSYACPPMTRWDYNTRGYTKARQALEAGVGMTLQEMTECWLCDPLGIEHSSWLPRPRNPKSPLAFITTARDLARVGELLLGRGCVNGKTLVEPRILQTMLTPSQPHNPSYGHLWWLNGQQHWIGPRADRHGGMRLPAAPKDAVMAYGRFSRYLWVAPSRNLVAVRLGGPPPDEREFESRFWQILSEALQ